ncbi:FAD-binding oxidoreductase [Paenibacillus sp. LHD-117]|uniref:FAD-binding oxidoreductase n=1 Tax=Paenibacillus sp. LHD-117 TaxID=3071412 RepID=UPI0027DF7B8B|nr:FAD-binding oxidoreductase [Paenibacillus sp. LHD-117]MDQ6423609.1 FAD-binding oxidoreductase [Paenibacillus sp. LHD-117]
MNNRARLTGRVIFQGDPGYETARKNWNPSTDRHPKVFVFARNARDVSNAVRWAEANGVPIRARSGRHALAGDLSQVDGGIVIDVSEIRSIELNRRQGTVIVGTGNTIGRIVKTLARQGYLFPFGDSPTVGVGGIALGGGIGPLQRTIGIASDNLIGVEMVDASGNVIQADSNRNSDLLWASRGGGGGNFGIYTRYKFQVVRAPSTATVFQIQWPWEQFEEVTREWQRWAPGVSSRLGTYLEVGQRNGGNAKATGVYLGSKATATRLLAPLLNTGQPQSTVIRSLPYTQVVDFLLPPDPVLTQQISFQFSSAYADRPLPDDALRIMRKFLEKAQNDQSGFFFLNWGGAINNLDPSDTAFFWRDAQYYVEWNSSWIDPSEAEYNIELANWARKKLQPYIYGSYINVPDQGIKDYGAVYYGSNYPRLREIKAKYDPRNVFNFPQSIKPARRREDD